MRFLPLVFFLLPVSSFAQFGTQINYPQNEDKRFHFGINVGANKAHYNFTHHPYFLNQPNDSITVVESVNNTGINLGLLVNYNLSEHFDIRTYPFNLVFTEKAFQYRLKFPNKVLGEDTITIKKIQGITLSVPFQLKFSSDRIENFKVYMMAGGKVEYDFAASKAATGNEELIKLQKLDYGVEAGMGFHLYFPYFVLSPELKVGYGLRNVHNRDPDLKYSNVVDRVNARTITFSLTVE